MAAARLVHSGSERRRFERFELIAEVELRLRDQVVHLPIVNSSAGGGLLRIERAKLPGVGVDEQVSVCLDVAVPEPLTIIMDATIVRVIATTAATDIALMWTSSNAHAVVQLNKLLDYVRTRQP